MTEQEYDELNKRLRKAEDARYVIYQMRAILDGPGLSGDIRLKIPMKPPEGIRGVGTEMSFTGAEIWPFIRQEAERRLELAIKEMAEL